MLLFLSLVLHEQEFEKEDKRKLKFLRFFFQGDTKGTNQCAQWTIYITCRVKKDATSVQPLWRSHVDLSVIGLAREDAPADLAVGGGEEDLRRLEMEPEVLLRCDGGFRRWSSSGELYDTEAEAGQERQRTTLT